MVCDGVERLVCGAYWNNDWANRGSIDFFFPYGFHVLVKGNGMEFKGKIMLSCLRK